MFVTCYSISTKDGYWANSRLCWEAEQTASLETESYYVAELAYYVSGIFIHVFLDQPLKDYWVMFSHHVITILLIYCSYVFGYQRVGMLVLLCHDVSDIFLDYAKCFHYLDLDMLSTLTFVNMLISWVLYRLYYYPTIAINSAMFESIEEGPKPKFHELFCIWLSLLQILHVYWFGLMLDVARRRLFEGEIEDVRDDEAVKRQSSQRKPKTH
ncbi:uncharacterized protein MONBRDRAFT_20758 [Monosiga brevicollis MX1]|uniref:TLC domain-containing protein n=1 Tax=Monosiga brevicollis TaxID=81824 RepID=A9UXP4_MONBE|nr:uncharacterized protein MONBRDRAFT_20758 [Monosiga brevicollis MX1]EDQ89724.1 predicted protein [Monosiga brevicollis MX1]|eukprot:XP_001745146.1 hypothetical protein [Monosiga brevicollis MX1]